MESANLLMVLQDADQGDQDATDSVGQLLRTVHNARMGHHGVKRTWVLLNKHYPGHGVPFKVIEDFVQTCVLSEGAKDHE